MNDDFSPCAANWALWSKNSERFPFLSAAFFSLIDKLDQDVFLLDAEGRIRYVNDFFLDNAEGEREDFLGKICPVLDEEEQGRDADGAGAGSCLKLARSRGKYVNVYNRLRGSGLQYFKLLVFPLPYDKGEIFYILLREDISSSVQLQQRVMQTEKLAAIGELSTYIAHEIRNPLFAIGGFANSLLRNSTLDESGREKAGIILEESQRLDGILKNILNFSKPVGGSIDALDLGQVAEQTVAIMRMGEEERGISTTLSVSPHLPHARGNADLLKQCLINIIKNAQEAMPSGGSISVGVRRLRDFLELSVRDTGTGMSPEVIRQIFNPFFSTKHKGSGLGMAMTRKIIEDMGGKIEISSEEGRGSLIRVLLLPALAVKSAP
ncbi:MAG: PAS domain-containing sensor histidine kinase [Deltaproteobacteria bacterium]|jgi:signal transduction histidine kinase|nr:PAS domain-containing sensor histidine kinase [Deltaproteobacteria bacterium]